MQNTGRKTIGLKVRFLTRVLGASVAFALAFLLLSKSFGASGWLDYLGFISGGAAALLLAYALSLFGPIGGRFLIVATLLMLLGTRLSPSGSGFLHSPKDLHVLIYLVAAIADACGLLLVYRSTRGFGEGGSDEDGRQVADLGTATLDACFGDKTPSGSPHKN